MSGASRDHPTMQCWIHVACVSHLLDSSSSTYTSRSNMSIQSTNNIRTRQARFNHVDLAQDQHEELSFLPFPSDSVLFSPSVNPPSYQYVFTDFSDFHPPSPDNTQSQIPRNAFICYNIAYAWRCVAYTVVRIVPPNLSPTARTEDLPDLYPFDDTVESNPNVGIEGLEDAFPAGIWSSIPVPFAPGIDDPVVDEDEGKGGRMVMATDVIETADVEGSTAHSEPERSGE